MTAAVILASLQLAVASPCPERGCDVVLESLKLPVEIRCYRKTADWRARETSVGLVDPAEAFFNPAVPAVELSPGICRSVLRPDSYGAWTFAHEWSHYRAWKAGSPNTEEMANRGARRTWRYWLRRLRSAACSGSS